MITSPPTNTVDMPDQEATTPAPKWNGWDLTWTLSLFGTAIGAGVLFLPINAGIGGIIPMIVMTIVALPMVFWAHRGLTRLALSGKHNGDDITVTVEEHFGPKAGAGFSIVYFLSVYPILLVYAVTITNTVNSFIIHQIGGTPPPRWITSLLLIVGLIAIVRLGRGFVVKVMSFLTFPFIAVLVITGLMLIPNWSTAIFTTFDPAVAAQASGHGIAVTLLLLVPVMVFSFNHSPIISSFAVETRQRYGMHADKKSGQILLAAEALMVVVVMFFVFSSALALSPEQLAEAKEQNITILSYLANTLNSPIIAWIAPIVAMIAVAKSFLGHYLGAAEGFGGLVCRGADAAGKTVTRGRKLETVTLIFMLVSAWLVAWADPSVLGMIETLCGPTIALLLFLFPQYAIYKIPALRKYRGNFSNYFVIVIGIVAVGTIGYNIFQLF